MFHRAQRGHPAFRFLTSDFRLPTSDFLHPASGFRLLASGSGLRTPTSDFRLPTSGFWPLTSALLLFALPACSHYQLGTPAKVPFANVFVAPVENRAALPQAQALVATEIREALLKDGRVALAASAEGADVTLKVTLAGIAREMVAARPEDTGLARKYALNLRAVCTLTDRRSGRPLFENREITVQEPIYTDSGEQPAEYQALPVLARTLGTRIAHTILDVW